MGMTIAAADLQENDIIEVFRLGTPVTVMVHHVDHLDGGTVLFRWFDEDETLTGSSSVAATDTFTWWGR